MGSQSGSANTAACPLCGEVNEKKARFCVHCGNPFPRKRRFSLRNRYILFGAIGLIVVGAIAFFLKDGFESKLVEKVNDEGSLDCTDFQRFRDFFRNF